MNRSPKRVEELEFASAYQDDRVTTLDAETRALADRSDRAAAVLRELRLRLEAHLNEDREIGPADEKPPHY